MMVVSRRRPVVLITGASRGLGEAAARAAAGMGAAVALAARSLERLRALAGEIEAQGGEALAVRLDLASPEECRAAVQAALERFGRLDGLVNNGGTLEPMGPVAAAEAEAWRESWAVNVLGPVMLAQAALPALRASRGRIVNVTSGSVQGAVGGWGAYSSAKAALNQLTRVLAAEEPEVTVLGLLPGIVDTEMQAQIRERGKGRMAERNYQFLAGLYARGELVAPEKPGRAMAALALRAPHEWSGEVVAWDEARVREVGEGG